MPQDETHIGDGVYMQVDFSTCIRLRTERHNRNKYEINDYIYLEPNMLLEIIKKANELGWDTVVRE